MPDTLSFEYASFDIEAGKIKEFAHSIGLTHPVYFDKEIALQKGFKDIPAPSTFATVIDFWNDRNLYQLFAFLKLQPENVLHGEQSYEYINDICAGDTITAQVTIKEVLEKQGMQFYYLETVYKNNRDEKVLVSHATLIEVVS